MVTSKEDSRPEVPTYYRLSLKLDYPLLGLQVKATSWRLVQLQLLGINWIEQNTRDSHPVNVHFPSALHPDSTSTRRTVHCIFGVIRRNYQGMALFMLLLLFTLYPLGSVIGEPQVAPQLFLNRLNMSYGINYKHNGQLNHNIDRVWVVTIIKIPNFGDIKFPNISFNPECKFLEKLKDGNTNTNSQIESVKQICRDSAPLVRLFQYKEDYKQKLIRKLLEEDLQLVLKGKKLRGKRSTIKYEVPQPKRSYVHNSTHKMGRDLDYGATFLIHTNSTPSSHPIRTKRGFAAFIPALASLATIAVESIGSFLQKKCNAALAKGIKAIKSDQKLAWNSVKQLEDDFLMHGKYSLDSLEKIVHTINHLGDRVHHMESLLMGENLLVTKTQFLHINFIGRLLFAHKLNIYLTTVQETQLRLYDELERVLRVFLSAAETLSKGYLPASLFPPSVLCNITSNALLWYKGRIQIMSSLLNMSQNNMT